MTSFAMGFIDRSGSVRTPSRFYDAQPFKSGMSAVRLMGDFRYAFINSRGDLIVEPRFHHVFAEAGGLRRVNIGGRREDGVVRGGRWGFVDPTGVRIEPMFEYAYDFGEGLAPAKLDDAWGFIDTAGRWVIEPRYEWAFVPSDGLAIVEFDGKTGFIDLEGDVVIAPRFEKVEAFRQGLGAVHVDAGWRLIDRSGRPCGAGSFDELGMMNHGTLPVRRGDVWSVCNARGELVTSEWFDEVRGTNDGVRPVRRSDKWAFLHPNGALTPFDFDDAYAHDDGLAPVLHDGHWGFANNAGSVVFGGYDDNTAFSAQRAGVRRGDLWTFVDPSGRELFPPSLERVQKFCDGMAAVLKGGRWGYLDTEGRLAVPAQYDLAEPFSENLAAVMRVSRVTAPAAALPDVHMVPAEGLAHPVFEGLGADDHLCCTIGYSRVLEGELDARVLMTIYNWEATTDKVDPASDMYTERRWTCPENAYLRVENLKDPRAEVATLIHGLIDAGVPIREIVLSPWGMKPDWGAMGPRPDPRACEERIAFEDTAEYFEWVFSGKTPRAASENPVHLRGAVPMTADRLFIEERGTPVWFPDVHVAYGIAHDQGETPLDQDDRTAEVTALVDAGLRARFSRVWCRPTLENTIPESETRDGVPGIERIEYHGRVGYTLAFNARALAHFMSDARVRWREPELLDALRAVVLELDLEPIILWQRFSQPIDSLPMRVPDTIAVQLWERMR